MQDLFYFLLSPLSSDAKEILSIYCASIQVKKKKKKSISAVCNAVELCWFSIWGYKNLVLFQWNMISHPRPLLGPVLQMVSDSV